MMQSIERLYRRIAMVVGRGRSTVVNDAGSAQTMQVKLGEMEIRDDTVRLSEYGFASNPPPGTDVVVLFIGGDRNNGVIIATGNQTYRLKGLKTGEVALSDDLGQKVYLTRSGIVIDGGGQPIAITNTPQVTHDSPLVVMTGDLKVNGDIYDHNGTTSIRANYAAHTHSASGVATGTPSNSL